MIDNVAAARDAVRHLVSLGHRRIAHVSGPVPEIMSVRRREGYRIAMAQADLPVPSGLRAGRRLFAAIGGGGLPRPVFLAEPPTAVFAANDEMAFGLINELRVMGLAVPDDVSVVGFDDLFLAAAFHPPLTTVSQPRADIGRQAMTLLLQVLDGNPAAKLVEMPTQLKIRGSTARAPARKNQMKGTAA
jgi:LacI family transcriptional regulator, repressor for deo operon, udp, cdd, tsx, nupC, and nupG